MPLIQLLSYGQWQLLFSIEVILRLLQIQNIKKYAHEEQYSDTCMQLYIDSSQE